jgi:4-amino-4-deoxy-L-arabinose transferase-like glycosyltransferase
MQLIRKLRLQALFCAAAVLACALISRPYTPMGICDDGPYILMAQNLAATGHIVYNGWSAIMLMQQLYFAAAFIKLFGFSFTTVRMSTLLIAVITAFVLQRTMVRANISEGNATIATLALVLSPLYLALSVTFMSDITGLFAIVLCLYGCLRALQSPTDQSSLAWLCFAVTANALCGTSRQIAWLGVLVMAPSTLWMLYFRRRIFVLGAAAVFTAALFIFACMRWLKSQSYVAQVPLFASNFHIRKFFEQLCAVFLEIPFLLLPVSVLFIPQIRKCGPKAIAVFAGLYFAYFAAALQPHYSHGVFLLEPAVGDWVSIHGAYDAIHLTGTSPIFLNVPAQILLTLASLCGLTGLIVSLLRSRKTQSFVDSAGTTVSWTQLAILFGPFTLAYILLFLSVYSTTQILFDRYVLGLLIVALICLVRYYQESIRPRLPLIAVFLVAVTAVCSITVTHNLFSLYRARAALAAELRANGIPDTSVDNGWEYNFDVELQNANHINNNLIAIPANAYLPAPQPPSDRCEMFWSDKTPHIHPLYGVSFNPDACYGQAFFAPVHYSRWPYRTPGTLYVVRYTPTSIR